MNIVGCVCKTAQGTFSDSLNYKIKTEKNKKKSNQKDPPAQNPCPPLTQPK